jgi:beta-lactamase superfamily II metal-dependent hydrolase
VVRQLNLSHPSNLHAVITIIGYRSQGESVIFRIVDGIETKYCLVVDSYKLKQRNVTLEFLIDKYNVSHIDMLCWSHPHIDHSKGLSELIERLCGEKTEYILPAHFYNQPGIDLVTIQNKEEKVTIDEIFNINSKTKLVATSVEVKTGSHNQLECFTLVCAGLEPIPVGIFALTPISSILGDYVVSKKHNIDPNELSISLLIDINGYKIFLGADTIRTHIAQIDTSMLEGCKFVKIPHHGSSTSLDLLNYLPVSIDAACTTVYHLKGDLPEKSVIDRYKTKGPVFCTGDYLRNNRHSGAVEFDVLFDEENIEYRVVCYNAAKML